MDVKSDEVCNTLEQAMRQVGATHCTVVFMVPGEPVYVVSSLGRDPNIVIESLAEGIVHLQAFDVVADKLKDEEH